MNRRQDTGRCYCTRCAKKTEGYTNQTPQQLRLHLKKYGPGPRHAEFKTSCGRPSTPSSATLPGRASITSTNVLARQTLDDGPQAIATGRTESEAVESKLAHTGEKAQVRSRSSSLSFSGSFPNQGDDYFTIQSPHDSPEPDDDPVIYPSEHQLPALDPIAAAQYPQPSEIPSDQELEEFSAIKKLLPSDSVPAAFRESAAIRLIYLHAVKASIFHNHTDDDCTQRITEDLDILDAAVILPTNPAPARTLVTAKRRLGLDVDLYIHKQPICTICFKHYSQEDINKLQESNCTVPRCKGHVYREKRLAGPPGSEPKLKRVPAKIQPYAPWDLALRRMMIRPDFVAALRDSSKDSERLPLDNNDLMYDLYDAQSWNNAEIGLKRVFPSNGVPYDTEISPGSRRKISTFKYGLQVSINLDWYVR